MKLLKEIKLILKFLGQYRKKMYLLSALTLIGSLTNGVIPYIYGKLVDLVTTGTNLKIIFCLLITWLLLTILSNTISRFTDIKGSDLATKASFNLIKTTTDRLLRLPISYHKEKKMGEIIQRATRGSEFLLMIVESIGFTVVPSLLTLVIALGILFWVKWQLAIILLLILVIYTLITIYQTKPIIKSHTKLNKAYEKFYGNLYDSVLNIETVKSNTGEVREIEKLTKASKKIIKQRYSFVKAWNNLSFWQKTVFSFGFVLIFAVSLFLLQLKIISVGELIMFIGYVNLSYSPLVELAQNYRWIKRGMTAIKRTVNLLKIKSEEYQKKKGKKLKKIKGEVEFKNVTFGYKNQPVLQNLSFKVKAGEVIALVGESGVGKTTLVDLISCYYKPSKGKILIDGIDITKIDLTSLREKIAVVPQEVTLFNDTIKNNIKYGKPRATEKEIIEAAKAANAHQFIEKFPKKYNQIVGERGIKLSTGQKQRIAIARALLKNPKILILDEATSSLDSKTEKLVQEALKRLIKNRTTFIIAHRLSTVTQADKILVLKNGKIVERGNHKELIKKGRFYRELYYSQWRK